MRNKQVVIIGASDETRYLDEAYQIGKFIGENGWTLITGGRSGTMEAASKGALENNGTVVGILPGNDFSEANKYCTIVLPTGMGYARNVINILAADIIIAIGGKAGTLSELAYGWTYNKPIICCTFTEGWSKIFTETPIDDRQGSLIYKAKDVGEVFSSLTSFFNQ